MDSGSYQLKRRLVMGVCSLNILFCIIMAALAKVITNYIIDHMKTTPALTPEAKSTAETIATVGVIIGSVFGILFQLLGLIGAWKENVCLTITYGVLTAIGALYDVVQCFSAPFYIPSTLLAIGTTVIVFLFVAELRKNRNGPSAGGAQPYYA